MLRAGAPPSHPAAVALCDANLGRLSPRVAIPAYDRSALQPGVVHLSVGSFHRSHQAVYFDELATAGVRDWGVVGVGLRRPNMREVLEAQDGLYTVVTRGARGDAARVVGVMNRYLLAPEEREPVLAALTDERIALVTLTVTGAGYAVEWPGGHSVLGYLVEALDRRRRAGHAPFTVLSCDNLPDNGAVARAAVTAFARLRDERLATWIEENVEFPSAMVDRITPQTTPETRELLAREFGVHDLWPVVTEPFSQWFVEDRFCNRRPPLDEVGVEFVSDVAPYALMKTRLLNAVHCALGYLGSLAGMRRADETVRSPVLRAYALRLMADEVTPLLPRVPGIDLAAYRRTVLARLANPSIADKLDRLCRSGSAKVPEHVVSSIGHAREVGTDSRLLTMAVAAWIRYLRGTDERGRPLPLDDPRGTRLRALALEGGTDPRPLLGERALFGDLGRDEGFVEAVEAALVALDSHGVEGAVAAALDTESALAA